MARESTKHGPKLDDEMKHETEALEQSGAESHVDPERAKEGVAPPSEDEEQS